MKMSRFNWFRKHTPYCNCDKCSAKKTTRSQRLTRALERPALETSTPRKRGQVLARELKKRDKQ